MSPIELLWHVSIRFIVSMVVVGAILFVSAGSVRYWNGWLFMGALFVPMTIALVLLYRKDHSLLEKRIRMHEKEKEQRAYVKWSLLWFLISFAVPGLDYRFGWSDVPEWLALVSVIVMVSGYTLFIVAMLQNSFASRVIEIQTNQRLVDTGLYSVVRHPMYMAATIMYTACPFVLGSYYALIPAILLPLLLAYRIRNEEKVLRVGLTGYSEYTQRVKFRLIPYVW